MHLIRLPHDADLVTAITEECVRLGVTRGTVQVIGALKKATLGFYPQDVKEYQSHDIDEPTEILCGIGNISLLDEKPFVHMHLTLGKSDCSVVGGHAMSPCPIFAAECFIQPVEGPTLVREFDETTRLKLWKQS